MAFKRRIVNAFEQQTTKLSRAFHAIDTKHIDIKSAPKAVCRGHFVHIRSDMRKIPYAFGLVLLVSILAGNAIRAEDQAGTSSGRLTVTEENDLFTASGDKHYTQGMRVGYLFGSTPEDASKSCNWFSADLPFFESGTCKRKYDWTVLGQSMFTPKNLQAASPSPKDRPYGAWLYTGMSLLQESQHETHSTLENFEVDAGVVGPFALGNVTQNDFHQFIGVNPARGWQNQIHNEPGIVLTHERKWRFEAPVGGNYAFDAIPEVGATVGNIFTYAETGGMVRFGQNLKADYGPSRVRPSLSGTDWFDADQLDGKMGWYIFAGTQGRAVARNIFLDGNTFQSSPHVDKNPLVADFSAGVSVFWSDAVRVDFSGTLRTKEFTTQNSDDEFGGVNLVFRL